MQHLGIPFLLKMQHEVLFFSPHLIDDTLNTSWLLKEAKFGCLPLLRDNNFQSFVSQMCTILRKDIWSYWTVLMTWLKLITWRHWQFHQALLNHITWLYWTVSPGVTGPYHLTLLDSFTLRYWNLSYDVTQSTGQQSSRSVCNNQLFKLRLFLEMITINMTNFSRT